MNLARTPRFDRSLSTVVALGILCLTPVGQAQQQGVGILATSDDSTAVRLFWQPLGDGRLPAGGFRLERIAGGGSVVLAERIQPGSDTGVVSTLDASQQRLIDNLRQRATSDSPELASDESFLLLLRAATSFDFARAIGLAWIDPSPPQGVDLVYRVSALDGRGRLVGRGESTPLRAGEAAPLPPPPEALRVEVRRAGVLLFWEKPRTAAVGGGRPTYFHVRRASGPRARGETISEDPVLPPAVQEASEERREVPWFVDQAPLVEQAVYYTAVSVDVFGRESPPTPAQPVLFPDWTALTPPDQVVPELVRGRVRLTWSEIPSERRRGFKVVRSLNPYGIGTVITPDPVRGNTLLDDDVRAGTVYYYRVSSINLRGEESEPSVPVPIKVVATQPPPTPRNLDAEVIPGKVILRWDPVGEPVAGYRVERAAGSTGGDWQILTTTLNPAPLHEDALPLESEGVLRYRVSALGFDDQISRPSQPVIARLPDNNPPVTPIVTGIDGRDGRVQLDFDVQGRPGETSGVFVLRSTREDEEGFVVRTDPLPATATNFVDEDVEAGRTYYYRLVAVDQVGNRSPASDPVAVRVGAPPMTAPPAPRVRFDAEGYPKVIVEIDPRDDPSLRTVLERLDPNGMWRWVQGPLPPERTRLVDTKPPTGTTATYRIRLVAGDGTPGPASPTVEVEIP